MNGIPRYADDEAFQSKIQNPEETAAVERDSLALDSCAIPHTRLQTPSHLGAAPLVESDVRTRAANMISIPWKLPWV